MGTCGGQGCPNVPILHLTSSRPILCGVVAEFGLRGADGGPARNTGWRPGMWARLFTRSRRAKALSSSSPPPLATLWRSSRLPPTRFAPSRRTRSITPDGLILQSASDFRVSRPTAEIGFYAAAALRSLRLKNSTATAKCRCCRARPRFPRPGAAAPRRRSRAAVP